MPISYNEETNTFHLYNRDISYIVHISKLKMPTNVYFGKKIKEPIHLNHFYINEKRDHAVYPDEENEFYYPEHIANEYPSFGHGDMRKNAVSIIKDNCEQLLEFRFQKYKIYKGKKHLNGLPATYSNAENDVTSLSLYFYDELLDANLILNYSIFERLNVISRNSYIHSNSISFSLNKFLSMNLDLRDSDYEMIEFTGAWARERHVHKQLLAGGIHTIESLRGHSSSNFNPFVALARKDTNENHGEVIGLSLVYSGNYQMNVQVDTYNQTRIQTGIHPDTFYWTLDINDEFQSPESLIVYSEKGLNGMSQTFHTLFNDYLIRGIYKNKPRPILINNWEATYFDFNEDKLMEIVKEASNLGIELFVLDDGWFKKRNSDMTSLGDWYVDEIKFPHGLKHFSNQVKAYGMRFGLWIEPEMINEESDLYRQHPEWVLHKPNHVSSLGRHQLVLDMSNDEVIDYLFETISKVLTESEVDYIKWDMNRTMSEVYSVQHSDLDQGKIYHKYILGLYKLYDRFTKQYPNVLFESCASGGARFDPGMLYYAPQAWTSDNTDAIERLKIQYGTSYVYPLSSMGSHVSAVPNHQVNRITPISSRANVAYFGTFGYELDVTKMMDEEKEEVKQQIKFMKENRELLQFGTFYRLKSPFEYNSCAWQVVSKDKKEAIVGYYRILQQANSSYEYIKLCGLDPNKEYILSGETYCGDELMNFGIMIGNSKTVFGDFESIIYHLKEKTA